LLFLYYLLDVDGGSINPLLPLLVFACFTLSPSLEEITALTYVKFLA